MELTKWITLGLAIVTMVTGATLWISSSYADIKTFTIEQDNVTSERVLKRVEQRYVPKEEFTAVETKIEEIKEQNTRVMNKLDRLLEREFKRK